MKTSVSRITRISLLTVYLFSYAFSFWLGFSEQEFKSPEYELITIYTIFFSFSGLIVWCAIFPYKYPEAVRMIQTIIAITLFIVVLYGIFGSAPAHM